MKLKHILGISAMALSASVALTSCDEETYDVVGNPANIVYFNIAHEYPANMPKNTYAYSLLQTPVGPIVDSEPEQVELYVQCTKNATSDITVKLTIDQSQEVEGYEKFPENSGLKVTLAESTVTIPAGSNRSNSVAVTLDATNADWAKFDGTAYVLPIRITDVTGSAVASVEKNFAYIGVNVDHKDGMLNTSATSATGTRITDCSAWTGTFAAPNAGRAEAALDMSKLVDNNRNSYAYYIANHADKVHEEVINTIDLGAVKKITGCMFRYFYYWYTIGDGTIYTSTDGVNYTEQGTMTWNDDGMERYLMFWAPMEVRYIRLVTHSFYGGTGEGTALSDINVYE